jgi:hypothetical protein
MSRGYYIEQGPLCGLSSNTSTLHGPYAKFTDAVNARDANGTLLLWGHTPLRVLRNVGGEPLEVWPGSSDHLVDV